MTGNNSGLFVVIEGIDGAGTTTQARKLTTRLQRQNKKAIFTFEPTDGPIGSMIRQVLRRRLVTPKQDGSVEPINANTMTLLFSADRLDHLCSQIDPALEDGQVVVCDRYYYSTVAYQGVDGDIEWVKKANEKARRPDIVFYLRISPEISLTRIGNRGESEIYEKVDFLEKVSSNYDEIFHDDDIVVTMDATRPLNDLADEIYQIVSGILTAK